jgi:methionyl-tRNA synthetase
MNGRFYVTTPIYYVNDVPHIGHTYTTIVADVLARFHRMLGEEVRFLTGTDEHGQKIERAARQRGMQPIQLADEVVERFRSLWTTLGISNDDFIRTTEARHRKGVEALFSRMLDKGDVYKDKYAGWYCTSCESFFPENQVVDGLCPDQGHKVEWTEEESYFFRLSRYQEPLLAHYRKHRGFVFPETRCNEVVAFVASGLRDLSISRSSLSWGIPFPADPKHILYVWFDALSNYVTALDYGGDRKLYERFWPADIHLVGKDILRFHAIYWPAYLMSAGLPLPERIVAHGWWLRDAAKISKSQGGVVDPIPLIREFGVDPLRYFLMREMVFGQDANYSDEAFIERVNTDLANDLGNLASRCLKMVSDYCAGVIPPPHARFAAAGLLQEKARAVWDGYIEDFRALDFSSGLARVWGFVGELNRFIVQQEPWKAARDPNLRADLESTLYAAAEGLRIIARLIAPVVPGSAARLWRTLGMTGSVEQPGLGDFSWGVLKPGSRIVPGAALFPRIDKAAYLEEARRSREVAMERPDPEGTRQEDAAGAAATPPPAPAQPRGTTQIDINEFGRLELRTARITAAERVEGADKLLKLTVDIGTESRTIVAGVALRYRPENLVGKMIVVVANLKPAKLRGVLSEGMLLAASDPEGQPYILTTDEAVSPGWRVR